MIPINITFAPLIFLVQNMGIIKVENIRVFANHGCLAEETTIGSDYRVDIIVKTDLLKSALSDNLNDTVDYVVLNAIATEEMQRPSKLLETVAKRILDRIFTSYHTVGWASVAVAKINPPIGGDVEKVVIVLEQDRG